MYRLNILITDNKKSFCFIFNGVTWLIVIGSPSFNVTLDTVFLNVPPLNVNPPVYVTPDDDALQYNVILILSPACK